MTDTSTTDHKDPISALETARAAKAARMQAIMTETFEEGRSTDEAEQEEFDSLQREVEAIDKDLKRYRTLEQLNGGQAKSNGTEKSEAAPRAQRLRLTMPPPEPGCALAQVAKCLAVAQGNREAAAEIAQRRYGEEHLAARTLKTAAMLGEVSDLITKCPIDPIYATNLVIAASNETGMFEDFLDYLRPQTIVGRATDVVKIPLRTRVLGNGSTDPDDTVMLTPRRLATLVTFTSESMRDSSPAADRFVRDRMCEALVKVLDDAWRAEIGDENAPIYLADEGGCAVDVAYHLTPEHFLHDLVVLKVERTISWTKR
jgi:hypothetical protein